MFALGSLLLYISPMCVGLISTWVRLVEARHKHTVAIVLWYYDKGVA